MSVHISAQSTKSVNIFRGVSIDSTLSAFATYSHASPIPHIYLIYFYQFLQETLIKSISMETISFASNIVLPFHRVVTPQYNYPML
jgi:hypothetical protein